MFITVSTAAGEALDTAAGSSTVYLAGPLDAVNAWMSQWGTSLQVTGGIILAICMVLVGIKLGAKTVVSNGTSSGSGNREAVGAIFGLAIAGVLIGAAMIVVPLLVSMGSNSGTPTAPPVPAAPAA